MPMEKTFEEEIISSTVYDALKECIYFKLPLSYDYHTCRLVAYKEGLGDELVDKVVCSPFCYVRLNKIGIFVGSKVFISQHGQFILELVAL